SSEGVVFAGINAGDMTGFSVADAGDVNHVSGGTRVDDLLIGAPNFGASTGWAYLVYGGSGLPGLATTTNNARYINLANVNGGGGTNSVPGGVIKGPSAGSLTGSPLPTAGDFHGDRIADILLRSPRFSPRNPPAHQGPGSPPL